MKTVWKFPLPVRDEFSWAMPKGAEIIAVQPLTETILEMWAIVDPEAPLEERRFSVRGTGRELGDIGRHLGTVRAGSFVWHCFEAAESA